MAATDANQQRWAEYKERRFGSEYSIWHDGLNTDAVTWLSGAAREEALEMLRIGLELGDAHAASALAAMADRASVDALRQQLARAAGSERVRMALALNTLSPDPELATHLSEVLESGAHWGVLIEAAIGLRDFAGPADEQALLRAISSPDYLVRYHAAESLLARWKVVPAMLTAHPELLGLLASPVDGPPTDADFAGYAEARRRLESLKAG